MDAVEIHHPSSAGSPWQSFDFSGRAGAYFRIWLPTTILAIVTLGLYSPWAFLRQRNFFLSNTRIAGGTYYFNVRPLDMLKARLLGFALTIAVAASAAVAQGLPLICDGFILLGMGVMIWRAFELVAARTSFGTLRFGFHGTDGAAFKAYVVGPMLNILTLGLFVPITTRWGAVYLFNNLRLGDLEFQAAPSLRRLYRAWLVCAGLFLVLAFPACNAFLSVPRIAEALLRDADSGAFIVCVLLAGLYVILNICSIIYCVLVRNVIWSSVTLGPGHRLRSRLSVPFYLWLVASNGILRLVSLGLLSPWASVRYNRYIASRTEIAFQSDRTVIEAQPSPAGSLWAAEYLRMRLLLPSV